MKTIKKIVLAIVLSIVAGVSTITTQDANAQSVPNPINNVANVNYVKGYGVGLFENAPSVNFKGRYLPTNSNWKTFKVLKGRENGEYFYELGKNELGNVDYLDLTNEYSTQILHGIGQVNYVPGYGIALWSSPQADRHQVQPKRRLATGSKWWIWRRTVVDGKTWYQVGTNIWAEGRYVDLIAEGWRGHKFWDDNGNGNGSYNPGPSEPDYQKPDISNPIYPQPDKPITPEVPPLPPEYEKPDITNPTDPGAENPMFPHPSDPNDPGFGKPILPDITNPTDPQGPDISNPSVPFNKAEVTVKYVDEDGNEVYSTSSEEPIGFEYTASYDKDKLDELGYHLKDGEDSSQTIIVSQDGNTVTFIVFKNDTYADINIKYVDENNNEVVLTGSKTHQVVGQNVSVEADEKGLSDIGYHLADGQVNPQIILVAESGNEVTFKVAANVQYANVTVKYIEKSTGREIQIDNPGSLIDAVVGSSFSIYSNETGLTAAGYRLVADQQNPITGTVAPGGNTVTFYVEAIPVLRDITIKYVDADGKPVAALADGTVPQKEVGTTVPVSAEASKLTEAGYHLVDPSSSPVDFVVKDSNNVVTFVVAKDPETQTVTVIYHDITSDSDMTSLTQTYTGEVGDVLTITAREDLPKSQAWFYQLVAGQENPKSYTVIDGTNKVVFNIERIEYTKDVVTLRYDDTDAEHPGENVPDTTKYFKGAPGTKFTADMNDVLPAGYTFNQKQGNNPVGVWTWYFQDLGFQHFVTIHKIGSYNMTVIVQYVDEDGNPIDALDGLTQTVYNIPSESEYSTKADVDGLTAAGYKLAPGQEATVTQTIDSYESSEQIKHIYIKVVPIS